MSKYVNNINHAIFDFFAKNPEVDYLRMEVLRIGGPDDDYENEEVQIQLFEPDQSFFPPSFKTLDIIIFENGELGGEDFSMQKFAEEDPDGDKDLIPEINSKECIIIYADKFVRWVRIYDN